MLKKNELKELLGIISIIGISLWLNQLNLSPDLFISSIVGVFALFIIVNHFLEKCCKGLEFNRRELYGSVCFLVLIPIYSLINNEWVKNGLSLDMELAFKVVLLMGSIVLYDYFIINDF